MILGLGLGLRLELDDVRVGATARVEVGMR